MRLTTRHFQAIVGTAAILAPALHIITDAVEWIAGGFVLWQLWVSYFAFVAMPFIVIGLFAFQRPTIGMLGLVGSFLYGASFVYLAHTTIYSWEGCFIPHLDLMRLRRHC